MRGQAWAVAAWLGIVLALGVAPDARAECDNTGTTCTEARRIYQRVCARLRTSKERQDCYAAGKNAHEACLRTGRWQTRWCDLPALDRK